MVVVDSEEVENPSERCPCAVHADTWTAFYIYLCYIIPRTLTPHALAQLLVLLNRYG